MDKTLFCLKFKLYKILFFITCILIVYVFLYNLWLINLPELFDKAYELGVIFNGLAMSYIVASIFYFIVDYLPRRERRRRMLDNLSYQADRIEKCANTILEELHYNENDKKLTISELDDKKLKSVLENTSYYHRTSINTLMKKQISVIDMIHMQENYILTELADIEKHDDLLSPELFKSLKEVQRGNFFKSINAGKTIIERDRLQNFNMVIYTEIFDNYFRNIKTFLDEWAKNKNKS